MTTIIKAEEAVLKTDAVGRVKTPPERRESLLDEFERSGLSGTKLAQLAGIKYQTFAVWAARRRKQRGGVSPPGKPVGPVRWLEAVVAQTEAPAGKVLSPVRLQWAAGAWVEITDLQQVPLVAALVQALAKPPSPC